MLSETVDELSKAQERLATDSEVARQVIGLVAPHMDRVLASVYEEFRTAITARHAYLNSRDRRLQDPYFSKYGEAIASCRRAMSQDLLSF